MMPDQTDRDTTGWVKLGEGARGLRGTIVAVGSPDSAAAGAFNEELERRLLEIGLVEGASVEILHEGFIGRDPIAVRVDDMRVALRRREANAVMVRVSSDQSNGAKKVKPVSGSKAETQSGPGQEH